MEFSVDETYAQSFIRYVKLELDDVKRSFIKIGFRLNEAEKFEYYKELGYNNIVELAEAEFGLKKSTAYGMMKLSKLFCSKDELMYVDKKFEKYSYTQLLVLSTAKWVGSEFWQIVKPSDSVSKLRSFVLNWNNEYKKGCGWHPGLKTVDDYLKHAEEQKEKKHIYEVESMLAISEGMSKKDDFSNRLEKSDTSQNLKSDKNQTNIEHLRNACVIEFAFLVSKCVCEMPEAFGEGMPYKVRLNNWLENWCLQYFE